MTNVYFMVIQKGISSGVFLFYKKSLGRRQPKVGRTARKKRGYKDDDMEIMDLNDL